LGFSRRPPQLVGGDGFLQGLVCVRIVGERIAGNLSKDDLIDMQGTVVAVHSGGLYRVQCDAGHEVLAQLSGRMRRFRIKVVPGDRVTVGVSPYDPVRGIITFRAR
jgi:translation initiation factor IF-1